MPLNGAAIRGYLRLSRLLITHPILILLTPEEAISKFMLLSMYAAVTFALTTLIICLIVGHIYVAILSAAVLALDWVILVRLVLVIIRRKSVRSENENK